MPTEGVYYFERAVQELGVDYFSICVESDGTLKPQYTTLEYDKNGYNTFPCDSIRESIDKHECLSIDDSNTKLGCEIEIKIDD